MSQMDLKKILDERGIKPTPFAKEIGVATSTIFSIYRGETKPCNIRVEIFIKIAHGLNMTPEELFYGEDSEDNDEAELLAAFRSVNDSGKEQILRSARRHAQV